MNLEMATNFCTGCVRTVFLIYIINISCAWGDLRINNFATKAGTFNLQQNYGWWWDWEGQQYGTSNTGSKSTQTTTATSRLDTGFDKAYVPFSGQYKMRLRLCPNGDAKVRKSCTISKSDGYIDSALLNLTSTTPLVKQDATFNLPAWRTIPAQHSVCYTFVDSSGVEWATPALRTCQDGGQLPETPANCFLNSNVDMNVDLGTLERSKIATMPAYNAEGNVKKEFPVLCTRDGGVTLETTFQFTPITINGNEVVSTSLDNIGVAIFYNGKLVGPSSAPIVESFPRDYSYRELTFQAVRNPNVSLKEIPTGDFTATAVLVMTEQ
ncbi:hypothetical protein R2320_002996 [Cronobacter turicensis]|nr:hypothetical protein [Cronobacter turicensis]